MYVGTHADTLRESHDWTFGGPFSGRGERVPTAAFQVIVGGLLVFFAGMLIGSS